MQSQLMQSLHRLLIFATSNKVTITTFMMLVFLGLFLLSWLIEPRRLINGLILQHLGLAF